MLTSGTTPENAGSSSPTPNSSGTTADNSATLPDTSNATPDTSVEGQSDASPECAICLESISSTNEGATASCGHAFHLNCMTDWLRSEHPQPYTCLNCRQLLTMRFLSQVIDSLREETRVSISHSPANLRFSIHIDDDLDEFSPNIAFFNTALEWDLEQLWLIVQSRFFHHRDSSRQNPWHTVVLDDIMDIYEEDFPRTDYITQPTLIRLTAVAALIHLVADRREGHQRSVRYSQLLACGDLLLTDAQCEAREAVGTSAYREYRRLRPPSRAVRPAAVDGE